MKKVVIIHNIISPHVTPLFKEIAKKVDLIVLYCAEKEDNRSWDHKPEGFSYKVLKNSSLKIAGKDLFTLFINTSLNKELKKIKPDVIVVSGWDQPAYYNAYIYSKFSKTKFVVWSGSTEYEKSLKRTLTKGLVKSLIKGADSFIAYGSRARKYLISLGANAKKIYISHNTTDINKYKTLTDKYRQTANKLKQELGVSGEKIILFYGQLIERKGVMDLVEALRKVQMDLPETTLLVIGNGQQKKILESKKDIQNLLVLPDPGDEEICKYFALADVFVLPSKEEVWGLVVNEAMAGGLPVIVSDKAGSSVDLVKNGTNGYIFQSGNTNDLSKKITTILSSKALQTKMSENSKRNIQKFTPILTAKEFLKAVL